MAAEGENIDPELVQTPGTLDRGHGHFFYKKNFGKPTYCHHCCEMLWGILSQGYMCEVCNFTCHEKCLKTVVSYCSGVAMQLIKNPVAHSWSELREKKPRKFCNVCRKSTDDQYSIECEVCDYFVHVDCQDLAVSDCKEAATGSSSEGSHVQHHHWREGNLPERSKCGVCKKSCWSAECLAGMRCIWCQITAHAICYKQLPPECDFGALRKIMLPPNCLTIPRTELPMEQLLSIRRRDAGGGTSPLPRVAPEEPSTGGSGHSSDEAKEKDDYELVRVFDGNISLQNNVYRTMSVPKTANVSQIKRKALRTFHILDSPDNYCVNQVVSDDGRSEFPLEDPMPLKSLHRREGRKPCVFLRYLDSLPDKSSIRVYGGWLRIPVTFCNLQVTKETLVQSVIADSLVRFGLDRTKADNYNLVQVSLDKGIAEKTLDTQELILDVVQSLRRDSIRKFHLLRFYLQEKEDPHGSSVSVFIGNLPPNLNQRQYETILLRLLKVDERPFTQRMSIFYEYGSLVLTFTNPKEATTALKKLSDAKYDEKHLVVICLPNIHVEALPEDTEPLMVLVNVKSGGCQGWDLIRAFRKLLNPFQVFDVINGGPLVGLYVFRYVQKYRILACGGDGTIGWVLQSLDNAKQDSACFSPPCGVVPLGTGNDLARVLHWGGGYTGAEDPMQILKDTIEAEEIRLDRWTVVFREEERQEVPSTALEGADPVIPKMGMNNPEDQSSMIIMNNYFGIGIDAEVCLAFSRMREANPEKFQNRVYNKFIYGLMGLRKMMKNTSRDLHTKITLEVNGKLVPLKPPLEGLIILNILSWGGGATQVWGKEKEEGEFKRPTHYDGLLEIVGVKGVAHLGKMQPGLTSGIRIAQGEHIRIKTQHEIPIQVDGEPQMQPPGTITILKTPLYATMLKKQQKAKSRRSTDPGSSGLAGSRSPGPPSSNRDGPSVCSEDPSGGVGVYGTTQGSVGTSYLSPGGHPAFQQQSHSAPEGCGTKDDEDGPEATMLRKPSYRKLQKCQTVPGGSREHSHLRRFLRGGGGRRGKSLTRFETLRGGDPDEFHHQDDDEDPYEIQQEGTSLDTDIFL